MHGILIGRNDATAIPHDPRFGNRHDKIETTAVQTERVTGSQPCRQMRCGVRGSLGKAAGKNPAG